MLFDTKNKIKVIIVCLCFILLGSIMFKIFSKDKKVDNKDENDKIIANEIGNTDKQMVLSKYKIKSSSKKKSILPNVIY